MSITFWEGNLAIHVKILSVLYTSCSISRIYSKEMDTRMFTAELRIICFLKNWKHIGKMMLKNTHWHGKMFMRSQVETAKYSGNSTIIDFAFKNAHKEQSWRTYQKYEPRGFLVVGTWYGFSFFAHVFNIFMLNTYIYKQKNPNTVNL